MIKKILRFIKNYLKEIVLVLLGAFITIKLTAREKEQKLTEKVNESIKGAEGVSEKQKQVFREQLARINGIADDDKRMEAKLKLWESLNG